jgi:hypothetical protein
MAFLCPSQSGYLSGKSFLFNLYFENRESVSVTRTPAALAWRAKIIGDLHAFRLRF